MEQAGNSTGSPVDNETYNLLQALTSKLEAIEAYGKYEGDMQGDSRSFLEDMRQQDRQHAEKLIGLLRDRLNDGGPSSSQRQGTMSSGG